MQHSIPWLQNWLQCISNKIISLPVIRLNKNYRPQEQTTNWSYPCNKQLLLETKVVYSFWHLLQRHTQSVYNFLTSALKAHTKSNFKFYCRIHDMKLWFYERSTGMIIGYFPVEMTKQLFVISPWEPAFCKGMIQIWIFLRWPEVKKTNIKQVRFRYSYTCITFVRSCNALCN